MEKLIIPSILSLTDASVLTEHVLKVIAPLTSGDAKLKRLYDALLPIHERLVKNLKSSLKSEFTELRASLDRTRDLASISFRDVVHALSIVPIPEMSAKVAFLDKEVGARERQPLIAVHENALAIRDGQSVLFLVVDGKVRMIPVLLGQKTNDLVALTVEPSVLKAGDKVVASPPDNLRDGDKVKTGLKQ